MFDQRQAAARVLSVDHEPIANGRRGAQDIAVLWSDHTHTDPGTLARSLAGLSLCHVVSSRDYSRSHIATPLSRERWAWSREGVESYPPLVGCIGLIAGHVL